MKVAFITQRLLLQAEEKHSLISLSSDSPTTPISFSVNMECYFYLFGGSGLYFDSG